MSKPQIIGLETLSVRGTIDTPQRAHKKRVFTEDEWRFLNMHSTADLKVRIERGHILIRLLYRPEMMNMTPQSAAAVSSNLLYQIDAINSIINKRSLQNG